MKEQKGKKEGRKKSVCEMMRETWLNDKRIVQVSRNQSENCVYGTRNDRKPNVNENEETYRHILLGQEVLLLVEQHLCLFGISQEHLKHMYTTVNSLLQGKPLKRTHTNVSFHRFSHSQEPVILLTFQISLPKFILQQGQGKTFFFFGGGGDQKHL